MKIIQLFRKRIENARNKRLAQIEKYLEAYFSRHYERLNYGKIAIPHFLIAQKEVARLKERGLLEVTYKQIKEGVA